jgi:hypothetical protein
MLALFLVPDVLSLAVPLNPEIFDVLLVLSSCAFTKKVLALLEVLTVDGL